MKTGRIALGFVMLVVSIACMAFAILRLFEGRQIYFLIDCIGAASGISSAAIIWFPGVRKAIDQEDDTNT